LTIKRTLLLFPVVCLLIALGLLLWRFAHSVESEVGVPVVIKNLPHDLIIVGQIPKEVEVRVAGQKLVVEAFVAQEQACVLDLAGATAGLVTLPVTESNLQFPGSVSIVQTAPTSFTLRIEPKLTKTVPVMVTLADNPAPGYRVTLTLASPSSLQIVGPEKALAQIDQLVTLPVSLKDVSESFKREIAVDLPSGVSVGGTGKTLVTAQVNLEENVVVQRFENIPVRSRNTDFPVKITPSDIDIDVRGTEIDLSGLSEGNDIKVYVDLKDLSPGVYVRRAQITLPVGTTLVAADPEVFTVTIGN
jgi:YbbR domain-containing protein